MAGNLANLFTTVTILIQRCAGILRLKEFDTSTPQGRSLERYRRVGLTAISTAGAKVVTVATMLVAVPLTLNYLGSERYGLWMTISSIVLMMRFADFGIGLGLMNAVSEAHGRKDRQAAVRFVSSGFFMLTLVALLIVGGLAVTYPFVPWPRIFNVKSPLALQEAGPAMAVFIACFAANLPLGVVQRVQLGYQEGYLNSLWESLGRVLGLAGLFLVIYLQAGLAWLVLAVAGAPVLAWLVNSFLLFGYKRPWLCPRLQNFQSDSAKKVLYTGLFFFLLQMGLTFIYSADNLIIAQFLGPEAVTQYAVPYQLFGFVFVITNIFIGPLWPAYTEALTRGDISWAKNTLYRSLRIILLTTGAVSLFLVIFGNQILHMWVGPKLSAPFFLNLGLGIWMVLLAFGSGMSIFLNAANIFRFQIIFISLTFIFSIVFKCLFIHNYKIVGVIWGTIIAFFIFFIIPYSIYIYNKVFKLSTSFNNQQ
jgi:O-antigen/teichoic acid export membrane protein